MPNKRSIRVFLVLALTLSLTHVVALAQTGQSPEAEKKAEALFRQGIVKAQKGDYKGAVEGFTQAIQLNDRYAQAYYQRGLVLLEIPWPVTLPSSSTKDFERAIQLDPKLVEAYLQLGAHQQDIRYIDRALAINPGIVEAYYYRGRIRSLYAIEYLEQFHDKGTLPASNNLLSQTLKVPVESSPEQALAYVSKIVRLSIQDYSQAISLKPNYLESYLARGQAYMGLKEYESAASDFTSLVQLDPKQAEGYMKRGDARQELKDYKSAVDDFTQVIALAPQNVEAYVKRGRSRMEAGDKSGAIDDYIQIIRFGLGDEEKDGADLQRLADNPKISEVYYEFGMRYRYGRLRSINDAAIKNFNRALELNPKLARAYYHRGMSRFEEGQTGLAIEDFNTAIHLIPGDADLYFSRAQARVGAKDHAGAVADYTEALRLSTEITNTYYRRGLVYSASGDWQNAIADFTETIKLDVQASDAYYRRAIAYDLSGDKAKAIADYLNFIQRSTPKQDGESVVITEASDSIASAYYRGLANLQFGLRGGEMESIFVSAGRDGEGENYLKAIADFTQVIRLRPNLPEAYYQRARAHWHYSPRVFGKAREEQRLLAESDFDRALALRPSFAQAYLERGLINCDSLRIEKCIADLSRAIEFKPRWAKAYYERGEAFQTLRKGAEPGPVLADDTQAINLDPDYREAYTRRAQVRGFGGDTAGALADLAEVIRLSPDDVQEYRFRGEFRLALKDYIGAIEDFTHAIEIHPGVPGGLDHRAGATYENRGLARYELGDGRGAAEDYKHFRLVDRCPSCESGSSSVANASKADTFYQKGLNLSLRGDKRGAKENLEQAAKLYHTVGNMQKYQNAKYQISKL